MTIATALARGHSSVFSAVIRGIPYVFTERTLQRVDSASAPSVPTDFVSAVPALLIDDSQSTSSEINRETGVAGAMALEFVLSFAALGDASLLSALFSTPAAASVITADVDEVATTINLEDSTGLTGDHVWLGLECLAVSGSTATSLTVARGVVGWPYLHRENAASSYGVVTDVPTLWRGRVVEIFEHVVSPEGHLLDSTVGDDSGTYSRRIWSGTLDEPPQPGPLGMVMRGQSLIRKCAEPLGFELELETFVGLTDGLGEPGARCTYPIYVRDTDTLRVTLTWSGTGSGQRTVLARPLSVGASSFTEYITTVADWWDDVWAYIGTQCTGDAWYRAPATGYAGSFERPPRWDAAAPGIVQLRQQIESVAGYELQLEIDMMPGRCYWFEHAYGGSTTVLGNHSEVTMSVGLWRASPWVPVRQHVGDEDTDDAIQSTGIGIAETPDGAEIIRWDEIQTVSEPEPYLMIRIAERGIGPTAFVDLGSAELSLKSAAGLAGTLYEVILTLLQSSGTGLRGDYDLLAVGQGLGIDDSLIDVSSFLRGDVNRPASVVQDGKHSIEDTVGGWLALVERCLAMVDGKIALVQSRIVYNPEAETITTSDVLIDRVEHQYSIRPANVVKVDPSSIGIERGPVFARDTAAIHAEGLQVLEVAAPGLPDGEAFDLGWGIIRRRRGESIVKLRTAPWKRLSVGTQVNVVLAHPAIYDWASGARAPAAVSGLVIVSGRRLYDGSNELTLLVSGQGAVPLYLCPSSVVATVPATDRVTVDDASWWNDGDNVTVYTPGKEDTEQATLTIDAVSGTLLVFDAVMPGWVAAGAIVTYPPWASAGTNQQAHAFVRAGTVWS